MSYLVDETFEGAGLPAGWFATASADFDYSGAPLAGTQSVRLAVATGDYAAWLGDGNNYNEAWGKFIFRTETALPASFSVFFYTQDTVGAGHLFEIVLFSDGHLSCDQAGGGVDAVAHLAADTTYYFWWHFTTGSPTSFVEIWFDTVDVRPGSGDNHGTGTWLNLTASQFSAEFFYSPGSNTAIVIDGVQTALTDVFGAVAAEPTTSDIWLFEGEAASSDIRLRDPLGNEIATVATVTGVSDTGNAGTLTATGDAITSVTGVSSTAAVGTSVASVNVTTSVTGVSSTAAVGTLAETGGATKAITGVAGTAAVGTLTESADALTSVTGVAGTAAVGTAVATGGAITSVTGVSAAALVGTISEEGDSVVAPVGVSGTAAVGTSTAVGAAIVDLTGVSGSGDVGIIVSAGSIVTAVTGVEATGAVGTLVADGGTGAVVVEPPAVPTHGYSNFDGWEHYYGEKKVKPKKVKQKPSPQYETAKQRRIAAEREMEREAAALFEEQAAEAGALLELERAKMLLAERKAIALKVVPKPEVPRVDAKAKVTSSDVIATAEVGNVIASGIKFITDDELAMLLLAA